MKSLLFIPLLLLSLWEEVGGFTPRNNRNAAFFLIRLSSSTHPSERSDLFFPPPISHENLMRYQQRAAQLADEENVVRSNTFDLPQLDDTTSAAFRLLDASTVSNSKKTPIPILLPILTFANAFMLILLIALSSESGNTERPNVPNKPPITTIQERRTTVIEQDASWGTDGSAGFFFY
jgi:hypothetical protein